MRNFFNIIQPPGPIVYIGVHNMYGENGYLEKIKNENEPSLPELVVLDSASTQDDAERLDFLYPKSSDDSDPCFARPGTLQDVPAEAEGFSSSELHPAPSSPLFRRSELRLGVLDGGGRL